MTIDLETLDYLTTAFMAVFYWVNEMIKQCGIDVVPEVLNHNHKERARSDYGFI